MATERSDVMAAMALRWTVLCSIFSSKLEPRFERAKAEMTPVQAKA
jgi:hypothetical protein